MAFGHHSIPVILGGNGPFPAGTGGGQLAPQFFAHKLDTLQSRFVAPGVSFSFVKESVDLFREAVSVELCPQFNCGGEEGLGTFRGFDGASHAGKPLVFQQHTDLFHFRCGLAVHFPEIFLDHTVNIGLIVPCHTAVNVVIQGAEKVHIGFSFHVSAENMGGTLLVEISHSPGRIVGDARINVEFMGISPQPGLSFEFLCPCLQKSHILLMGLGVQSVPGAPQSQHDKQIVRDIKGRDGTVVGISHGGQTAGGIAFFDFVGDIHEKLPDEIAARFVSFGKAGFALGTLTGIAAVIRHDIEVGHPGRMTGP